MKKYNSKTLPQNFEGKTTYPPKKHKSFAHFYVFLKDWKQKHNQTPQQFIKTKSDLVIDYLTNVEPKLNQLNKA